MPILKIKSKKSLINIFSLFPIIPFVTLSLAFKTGAQMISTLYTVRPLFNVIWVIILRLMDKSFIFRYLLADLLSVNDSSFNAPHNQNPGCGRRINQLGTALMVNIPCIMGLFKLAGHPIPPCRSSVFH